MKLKKIVLFLFFKIVINITYQEKDTLVFMACQGLEGIRRECRSVTVVTLARSGSAECAAF
jgi:hypothetical protein